jgi:hypothetical protein
LQSLELHLFFFEVSHRSNLLVGKFLTGNVLKLHDFFHKVQKSHKIFDLSPVIARLAGAP